MSIPLYQIDAFTTQPFHGNPAAVCLLDAPRPDEWMLGLAAEMNLSETAFLLPELDGYRLRWMTPKVEVRLCGHATLASAHILYESGRVPIADTIHFQTLSGLLTAQNDGSGWVTLDLPVRTLTPAEPPAGLAEALGVSPIYVGRREKIYLLEVADEEMVRAAAPDFAGLAGLGLRSIILTARSRSGSYDFISRYFAPGVGINEDPVTGSAHCYLALYWSEKLAKTSFNAYQASPRGGELRLRLEGERVKISGQAVTIFNADLI